VRRFLEVVRLEFTSIVRSKALLLLSLASVVWVFAFAHFVKGDGTVAGAREIYLHYSLGGVFALLTVALLSSATGSIATERAARRLQLTLVRPVRYFTIALGKICAHVLAGAVVLALAAVAVCVQVGVGTPCNHAIAPILPTPREEAVKMYDAYMKSPSTPEAVKKAKKSLILRLLTQRALDNHQVLSTNGVSAWRFPVTAVEAPDGVSIRLRFTNQYEQRQDVRGDFRWGDRSAVVSNMTQAVLTLPLLRNGAVTNADDVADLTFRNRGRHALMLRPRKDLHLLLPADAFGWNLLRACVVMLAVLAMVISFGTFLSSALGRPVALFVAIVALLLGEMSPSVLEQYPDPLETNLADRIGLCLTRAAAAVTRPVSDLAPLEPLAKDECIERETLARMALSGFVVLPLLMALLAAVALPRKQEGE